MTKAQVQLFPHLIQPKSGAPTAAEWGQLTVPENRSVPQSRPITIPFVRFRSRAANPGSPIVFLQGGPGTSVLSYLPLIWNKPVMRPPIEWADCIFIEHRGFGLSRPSLDCPGTYNIALDEPGSPELYAAAHRRYLVQSITFWQEQGIDIYGYNAVEMAADIDDLRRTLGYDKLTLYGGSFGSHHAFTLLRYYTDYIERAFLWGIEGPNHTVKLPSNVQKQLITLNALLQEDAALKKEIPDLLELMAVVLDRLSAPVVVETSHPQSEDKVKVTIGTYDLQLATANGLGSVPFLRALPQRYLEIDRGDYNWLAEQTIRLRVNLESNLMYEATDIASGAGNERKKQIAAEAPQTLLGDAINEPYHGMGDLYGNPDRGDEFRGRLQCDVPLVLVGGTLDARTPISNAQELLPDLSNGRLVTVAGASHDIAVRGAHCQGLAQLRDRFFRAEELGTSHLDAEFSFQQE